MLKTNTCILYIALDIFFCNYRIGNTEWPICLVYKRTSTVNKLFGSIVCRPQLEFRANDPKRWGETLYLKSIKPRTGRNSSNLLPNKAKILLAQIYSVPNWGVQFLITVTHVHPSNYRFTVTRTKNMRKNLLL